MERHENDLQVRGPAARRTDEQRRAARAQSWAAGLLPSSESRTVCPHCRRLPIQDATAAGKHWHGEECPRGRKAITRRDALAWMGNLGPMEREFVRRMLAKRPKRRSALILGPDDLETQGAKTGRSSMQRLMRALARKK